MGFREYLHRPEAVSPLRKSLQDTADFRAILQRSARETHHLDAPNGYADYDDPGEAEGAYLDENAIVDQEAVDGRPHRPGYHGRGGRSAVAKSGDGTESKSKPRRKRKIDPTYQHPDGRFKGGFQGAVAYFQHQGYSKDAATKIAGKIAATHGKSPARKRG